MAEKRKAGRPPALEPDEKTVTTVKGLGRIQATTKECAAVLGVTEKTFIEFRKRHPEIQSAYEEGVGAGRASLRRRQFKAAEAGNATMLVWLGKQYLGQTDKQDINTAVTTNASDEERLAWDQINRRLDSLAAGK
jgi:hypothetical protein